MYTTHTILDWNWFQRVTPSCFHSIDYYNKQCEEKTKLYGEHIMVLRDNVVKITGYHWSGPGFAAQNCAQTDGYVDVRSGKHYTLGGENSFFNEIK